MGLDARGICWTRVGTVTGEVPGDHAIKKSRGNRFLDLLSRNKVVALSIRIICEDINHLFARSDVLSCLHALFFCLL